MIFLINNYFSPQISFVLLTFFFGYFFFQSNYYGVGPRFTVLDLVLLLPSLTSDSRDDHVEIPSPHVFH